MSGPGCMCVTWTCCGSGTCAAHHVVAVSCLLHLLQRGLGYCQPAATNSNRLNSSCTTSTQTTHLLLPGRLPVHMQQEGAQLCMTHTSPGQPYRKRGCCHSTAQHIATTARPVRQLSQTRGLEAPSTPPARRGALAGASAGCHQPASSLIDATSHTDHPAIHSTWKESKRD